MATFQIDAVNGNFVTDGLGSYVQPYNAFATNDLFRQIVYVLTDPAPTNGFYGKFRVPQNYVGSPKVIVSWTATATTGNVKMDFDYRAVAAGESYDQNSFQEALTVTDAAPGAVNERQDAEFTLTAANLAAGDDVEFYLTREDGGGTDTMAASALLMTVVFQYADA